MIKSNFTQALLFFLLLSPSAFASDQSKRATLRGIQELEDHRRVEPLLINSLKSSSVRIVLASLRALGRIQDPLTIPSILSLLDSSDAKIRAQTASALGFIGGPDAVKALASAYQIENNVPTRAALAMAIGRAATDSTESTLENLFQSETNPQVLTAAAHGLGQFLFWNSDKKAVSPTTLAKLMTLVSDSGDLGFESAFAISRIRGGLEATDAKSLELVLQNTKNVQTLAYLARFLARVPDPVADTWLVRLADHADFEVRVNAVAALQRRDPTPAVMAVLNKNLSNPTNGIQEVALETLIVYGPKAVGLAPKVRALYDSSPSPWIKSMALQALAAVKAPEAMLLVQFELANKNEVVQSAAILITAASVKDASQLAPLLAAAKSTSDMVASAAYGAFSSLDRSLVTPELVGVLADGLRSKRDDIVWSAAGAIGQLKVSSLLTNVVAEMSRGGALQIPLLGAIAVIGTKNEIPILEKALTDPEKDVVSAAADAYKAITGQDVSAKIPLNDTVAEATPSQKEIHRALNSEFVFHTNKGEFAFRATREAPVTAAKIMRLVEDGFYKNRLFGRVVPNFVIQGGATDTSPGMIRDEVSSHRHKRGTVGIATRGKDTGDTEFFVNQSTNLHLDGHYTLVGVITRGMDTIDKMEVGDHIQWAELR